MNLLFLTQYRPVLRKPTFNGCQDVGLFPGGNEPGHAIHSPQFTAEVKKGVAISQLPHIFMAM
jgi:hypothetical protein